jgi:hypothetical protein
VSADIVTILRQRLDDVGLRLQGGFHPEPQDEVPPLSDGRATATLFMVGQTGGAFWDKLQTQAEVHGPDPIDR